MSNTVLIKGGGVRLEEKAGGHIMPGHLLNYSEDGSAVVRHAAHVRNLFFIMDRLDHKLYAYHMTRSAIRANEYDIDFDPASRHGAGVAFHGDNFYVADRNDKKIYAYSFTGARESSDDIALHANNGEARGITIYNDKFYVLDSADHKVYVYNISDGSRDSSAEWDLNHANGSAWGITYHNQFFYVPDHTDHKMYAYGTTGSRSASRDFNFHTDNGQATGVQYADGVFWVLDNIDSHVYVYNSDGDRLRDREFRLLEPNGNAEGITFVGNYDVVGGFTPKMFATEHEVDSLGVDDPHSNGHNLFALHPLPGSEIYGFTSHDAINKGDLLIAGAFGQLVKASNSERDKGAVLGVAAESLPAVSSSLHERRLKITIV